jgi:hypothetical protein
MEDAFLVADPVVGNWRENSPEMLNGPLPVKEIENMVGENCTSKATLGRAGNRLGAERKPEGLGKGWMAELLILSP